ncbi:MAG: FAD-dependent oxidoreductase [Acidimicrobiaceae bacterium]|nr:FAD-dependent oxidoreductase [Acidimicrobiaceae bacterium]
MHMNQIVVVGASLAGLRACQNLRRENFEGKLTLVGAEKHLPYDRPPLSKSMLTTDQDPNELTLISEPDLSKLDLELLLGTPATHLDTGTQEVTVGDEKIHYDGLIIATGARARNLFKTDVTDGIHALRTVDDALAIRSALESSSSVVIVGAGFIGSEVAAAARLRGCEVTIVEANDAPLVRGLGHQVGSACGSLHEAAGVDLRLGLEVTTVYGGPTVEEVELNDGSRVPADLVVVGIGASPNTEWLKDSGLTINDGVVCDKTLNAGIPGIYAAGDVARAPNQWLGTTPLRTEHWTAATEHAALAAKNLLQPANSTAYGSVPFVWSDQYEDRIQVAGDTTKFDEVSILMGSTDERAFVAAYRQGQRLAGVAALNNMRPFVQYRRLLMTHGQWSDALDLSEEMKH